MYFMFLSLGLVVKVEGKGLAVSNTQGIWGMVEHVGKKDIRGERADARSSHYFGEYCSPSHHLL